jgi:hypothetical protein
VSDLPKKPFQFSLRSLLILVAVFAVLLAVGLFVKRVVEVPFDAYKHWAMGDLIVEHLETHDGEWPRNWNDLRGAYNSLGGRLIGGETMESLEKAVNVDFDFDPALASSAITKDTSEPAFRVIWLKNGSTAHYVGDEPNQRVFDYLKQRKFGDASGRHKTDQNAKPR